MSTETERQIQALLAEHIGAWSAQTRDDLTAKLAAREAAARREAETEVANAFIAWAAKNEIAKPPLDWAWFGEIARRYSPLHEEHNAEETP